MRAHVIRIVVVLVLGVGLAAPVPVKTAVGQQASGGEAVPGTPPLYDIHEIAPVAGYRLSEGLAITSGGMAAGRSLKYGSSVAFTWTLDGGIVPCLRIRDTRLTASLMASMGPGLSWASEPVNQAATTVSP